jgi:hypothetical protein
MRYATLFVSGLCVLFVVSPFVKSQSPPCSGLEAVPGAMGYQHRSTSVRCEGLYQSPVAGESLEFLSFVKSEIAYDLAADKVLVVAVPDVSGLGASEVSVRARALPLNTYYRMDTNVNSAKAIEWPLSVVLKPAEIHADSIGVVGWIDKDGTKTWVPLSVFPKGKPLGPTTAALAVFRSTVDIQRVQWRLWGEGGSKPLPAWQVLGDGNPAMIRAGDSIKISVPRAPQVLNLDIAAKLANSDDWLKTLVRVYVP